MIDGILLGCASLCGQRFEFVPNNIATNMAKIRSRPIGNRICYATKDKIIDCMFE